MRNVCATYIKLSCGAYASVQVQTRPSNVPSKCCELLSCCSSLWRYSPQVRSVLSLPATDRTRSTNVDLRAKPLVRNWVNRVPSLTSGATMAVIAKRATPGTAEEFASP